jgi:tetratricopeptide (TPR) repeat protein
MGSKLTPLLKLLYKPFEAMAELRVNAPFIAAVLLAVLSTFLYYSLLSGWLFSLFQAMSSPPRRGRSPVLVGYFFSLVTQSVTPVVFLALIFIPACLLAANLLERRGSFRVLLNQEYTTLAACTFYSWAIAHLIMLLPSLFALQMDSVPARVVLRFAPLPYFGFLLVIALRVVLRLSYGRLAGVLAASTFSLILLPLVPRLMGWLTSPFLLLMMFFVLRGFFGELISSQRARENFQQNLQAATLNPADASAHYNLGLIYQQRGEYEAAKAAFQRAIGIDEEEVDAHYQLGRIAREEERLAEAIKYFDAVVTRAPQHSLHEVWREIGRAYLQAGQFADARYAFEQFLERRSSDAEALYYYGLTLQQLGESDRAVAQMQAVIEAVNTSPSYKQRTDRRWLKDAEAFLKRPGGKV